MPAPLIIRIIGDATAYLKAAESTIAVNTRLARSTVSTNTVMGETSARSAQAQVAATAKAIRATEAEIAALKALEAQGVQTYGLIGAAQARLGRLQGPATVGAFGRVRGAAAFAGVGFFGALAGGEIVRRSIVNAEDLEAAQRGLATAIANTGGNVEELGKQYEQTAKAAARFGVDEVTATRQLERATSITGDAESAQRAYTEALVVSKALHRDFGATLLATSKAQAGMTSALRRLGVIVDTNSTGQEQYNAIMARYEGQADANTTATEKFGAAASNLGTTLGSTLLPAITPVIEGWTILLNKINDVADAIKAGPDERAMRAWELATGRPFPGRPGSSAPGAAGGGLPPVGPRGPFGSFDLPQTFFRLTPGEMIAQANAQLTKSMQDDVAAARAVVARIKRNIERGKYAGKGLIAALQAEAAALGVIWAAEDAAARERAAAAEKAREKIQAQIEDSIHPLRLEVALARAQALGKPLIKILKELRAAAYKALASGRLSLEQQLEAWNQITSLNEQLKDQADAQVKGIRAANTRILTADLGLTRAQRDELRARLASLDARGRSFHHAGVGAFGYEIGHSGRPIQVRVDLDGRKIAENTTRHQQRRHRRNSSQRRGPNAGD